MSQDSVGSLELLSQETYDVLQNLLGNNGNNSSEFTAKYHIQPFDVKLTDESVDDNLQINIERLFSFPKAPSIKTEASFNESPPDFNTSYGTPSKQIQIRPMPSPSSTSMSPDVTSSHHCFVPPNTDYPGVYQFTIGFQEEKGTPVKSAPWTYSTQLEKLFVKMRSLVPIRFMFNYPPPPDSYIKCVVVYRQPEHFKEVVERCLNHMTKFNDGHRAPKHLFRCESAEAKYETCSVTGRHTVSIPVRNLEAGTNYFTEMVQYMCFNSCPGGLNRRLINTIFSLEHNGEILGRKVLDSRICACPGRDRGNEESGEIKKAAKSSSSQLQPQSEVVSSCQETPPPTPITENIQGSEAEPKTDDKHNSLKRGAPKITEGFQLQMLAAKKIKKEEEEEFTIKVRGREKYELLNKIKEGLDMMDIVPQALLDSYRSSCPPCGPNWFVENQTTQTQANGSDRSSTNKYESNSDDSEGTPPSTFPLSQLSRTSSNVSTRSNQDSEYSTVRFTLKRTVSLEKKGLKPKTSEKN